MLRLRSFAFNFTLYVTAAAIALAATPALLMPRRAAVFVLHNLSRLVMWLLAALAGTHASSRGQARPGIPGGTEPCAQQITAGSTIR